MPEVEEMQKFLRLIARLIVARHECTYVRHCKENAPIYMYYVAPETPMMSSVIADCPDLATPNILDKSTPMLYCISRFLLRPHSCVTSHIYKHTQAQMHIHMQEGEEEGEEKGQGEGK